MDTATLIAQLVQALAWPITVVILAIVFRADLKRLPSTLQNLRAKGFGAELELDFKKDVEAIVEVQQAAGVPPLPPQLADEKGLMETAEEIARSSLPAAILLIWRELEIAMRQAVKRHAEQSGDSAKSPRTNPELIDQVFGRGLLPASWRPLLREFMLLRNRAAHFEGAKIDSDEIAPLALSAERLIAALQRS